ncbi:NUDIX domain-containing protein [Candidatus Woesearchaeota archaeon]|nr:NUDIX domain-containing protein [Candidatus Woesearchaeota archaeon]
MRKVSKIGLIVVEKNKILLVKKKTLKKVITPGGKPEGRENHEACLERELKEELEVSLDKSSLQFLGTFEDVAEGEDDVLLTIELYQGKIKGNPKPSREIEGYLWFGAEADREILSPIIKNKILPFLLENKIIA